MTPDVVQAIGAIVVANLSGMAGFFLMLDRRLTRLETRHELAAASGVCPFHPAHAGA